MGKTGLHKRYAMNNRSTRDLYYKARELSPKPMEGIDDDKFFRVVSGMNRLIAEEIENGQTVDFPCAMGKVFIKKFDMKPRIDDDGKLLVPSYIDWKATLKSWKEDPELQKERITIKYPIHPFYRIVYDKTYSKHTNKMYFGLVFARSVRQAFSKNIQDGMNCGFTKKY